MYPCGVQSCPPHLVDSESLSETVSRLQWTVCETTPERCTLVHAAKQSRNLLPRSNTYFSVHTDHTVHEYYTSCLAIGRCPPYDHNLDFF